MTDGGKCQVADGRKSGMADKRKSGMTDKRKSGMTVSSKTPDDRRYRLAAHWKISLAGSIAFRSIHQGWGASAQTVADLFPTMGVIQNKDPTWTNKAFAGA